MIQIKVTENIDRFIKKTLKNNINLYDIKKHKDYLLIKIDENDLEQLSKLNYYSKIEIVKYYGKKKLLLNIKKNLYDYIMLILFFILIYGYSNIIIDVQLKHENKEIIEKVNDILLEKNIKKFTLGKDLDELNKISDEILQENRDFLDFISINKVGMKYVVSIEERILIKEIKNNSTCHIVAKKDGVITNIINKKGISMVEKGKLVKKGDILISGQIILNEEIKDNVCADGKIEATTWYKITINYPFIYQEKKYTKREKINIKYNNKYLKKKLYENYDEIKLLKLGNIKIVKQKEYIIEENKYSATEAKKLALNEAENKLLEKIGTNNTIIDKKVLKESINDSTIELEIFISAREVIGEVALFEAGDTIDTNESLRHTD